LGLETEPLSPDNRLNFMTGPLTGTDYPCSSDMSVVTLNVNTGYTVGDSHTHGFFGAFLKCAGYDGIILQGAAKKPVYLWISDGEVEIRDAADLWGKDTHETEDLVKAHVGARKVSVAAIGPAGENLLHGASIENDHYHMAAKAGVGAVMGSKRLKAIAVKGEGKVPVAEPAQLRKVIKAWKDLGFKEGRSPTLYKAGITRLYDVIVGNQYFSAHKNMLSPVSGREWTKRMVEGWKQFKITPKTCWSCPIACTYRSEITAGPHKGYVATLSGGGESHEGSAGIVGIMDPGTVHYLTDLNDRLGVDSAELGCCLGLAFELYERGLITREQSDGLDLKWGNAEAAEALLRKIVNREGFGKIFAEGPKKAAEILGEKASRYVIHVKGAGYNMHDWRSAWGIMLGQVTAGAGACWQCGFANDMLPELDLGYADRNPPFTTDGLAEAVVKSSEKRVWQDCYGGCFIGDLIEFPGGALLPVRALAATVGWQDFDFEEAMTVGRRVITLERIFNMKRGLTIESDLDIGARLVEPLPEGTGEEKSIAPYLKDLIMEFYACMGWDKETGKPNGQTLEKLDLVEAAKGL
jgi:aldehyde:ferredoxin oxidoreductase